MSSKQVKPWKRIAVIGAPVLQTVLSPFNAVLARYAAEKDHWQIVFSSHEITSSAFRVLRELACDGAIVRLTSPEIADEARQLNFPIVNYSSWLAEPGVPTVRRDDRALGRLCAEHLLAKGFRRFGCLRLPGGWYIEARIESFVATLVAAGVDAEIVVLPIRAHPLRQEDRRKFRQWLAALQPPAALFLPDDIDAPEFMDLCRETGRRIPRDIAVVSAYGHAETLRQCLPSLSYAAEDEVTIATRSAEWLDRLMRGRKVVANVVLVPPLGLVAQGSTATVAVDDQEVALAAEFLRNHASEEINVADVARQVSIARVTLERRFRQAMGATLHDYLTRQRVERAKELLKQSPSLPLGQLAQQCGFASRKRLNAVFKQFAGKTPKAWRDDAK